MDRVPSFMNSMQAGEDDEGGEEECETSDEAVDVDDADASMIATHGRAARRIGLDDTDHEAADRGLTEERGEANANGVGLGTGVAIPRASASVFSCTYKLGTSSNLKP